MKSKGTFTFGPFTVKAEDEVNINLAEFRVENEMECSEEEHAATSKVATAFLQCLAEVVQTVIKNADKFQ